MTNVEPNTILISELRKQRGLTQEQLAERAGLSPETVQLAERDGSLTLDSVKAIAGALEVDTGALITRAAAGLPPSPLWQKVKGRNLLPEFERAAREVVIAGGMAAQGFYRNAGPRVNAWVENDPVIEELLREYRRAGKNPPSKADLVATTTILREADSLLAPKVSELGCGLSLLCEETAKEPFRKWLEIVLKDGITSKVHKPDDFFANGYNMIRVIADALDGTENFRREIAFYCSAVAILIDDLPRVAAIYLPIHGVVYSAVLPGPRTNPAEGATATVWETIRGNWADLTQSAPVSIDKTLDNEAVAVHLTRSNVEKRRAFIDKLDAIAGACNGVYALNAGLPAMASVATGGLGAFVNNYTDPWDVAAGEVLVRACGGGVTQFDGTEISYDSESRISVIAAKNKNIHDELVALLSD